LLHLACEHGQANLLRELIEGGLVDVNRNGKQGMELAIKYAYRDVMTVLLHRGVSVNEESLLHSAIEHGSIATVKFLLERGAELSEEVLEWCQTQLHEKHAKGAPSRR
jgi:ankyrin repeat protein